MVKITETEQTTLEATITEEEVRKALKEIPVGKSPGPDGLMILYYKKYQNYLIPKMCPYMNKIRDKGEMRREALAANIAIILKEDKDSTLCYRPISLLNVDTKLLAKVLADRLKQIINKIIHSDQVGFISGREGRDNGIKTLLVVQKIKESRAPGLLLSIDAENAFDRVDWGFMMWTLEKIGLGDITRRWMGALYSRPTARVRVNGVLSEPFEMFNGARQGCPLSPLLFVLALDPFSLGLDKIRTSVG